MPTSSGDAHRRPRHGAAAGREPAPEEESAALFASQPAACEGPADGGDDKMRRQSRAARIMASSAMLLAVLCVVLASAVLVRRGPARQQLQRVAAEDVVQQDEVRGPGGWYRTYLKTLVRIGAAVDSDPVQVLPVGTLVFVAEVQGRRARILQPVKGWMSMRTEAGLEIARPDLTYQAHLKPDDLDKAFRSERMREARKSLEATAAKLTAVEKKLLDALKDLSEGRIAERVQQKTSEAGRDVKSRAPRIGQAIAQDALAALKKMANEKRTQDYIKDLAHHPRLQEAARGHVAAPSGADFEQVDRGAVRHMEELANKIRHSVHS